MASCVDIDSVPLIPRYSRRGSHPAVPPVLPHGRHLKVAVIYAVCYRFRIPVFRRLSNEPTLRVRFFVGTGIPGTKLSNASDVSGLDVRILWTIQKRVQSTGRQATLMFNPTLPYHLAQFRPDVLLMQGGILANNLAAFLYAQAVRRPIVWWSLGEVPGRKFSGLSRLYRRLTKVVERRCTAYAAYSSASVDYYRREGYPATRCFNLVNVVDTDLIDQQRLAARQAAIELRTRLNLAGSRVVLFVGSMTETKGIQNLLHAFAKVSPQRADVRLVIVGDGPERAGAERLARDLRLDGAVFTGAVYDGVGSYFQLADLLVVPGTGGLVVSEGMAHALPVIAAIGDGVETDLIEDGVNGFRVSPHDVDGLAEKIQWVLEQPGRAQAMGQRSREIIETRANIGQYMSELLSCIYFAYTHRTRHVL